jgi:hypothetical protein
MWRRRPARWPLTGPNQRAGSAAASASTARLQSSAGQGEKEARSEELPDRQAAGEHAQQADPGGVAPAVARQHHQHDDVGQPRLDARQGAGQCRLGHRKRDRRRRVAGDAMVIGRDRQLNS